MFKHALVLALSVAAFSEAVIVTNYHYDSFGRPIGRTVQYQPGVYYNPSFNNPYYYPYYQYSGSLPGADPDRFDEIYEHNLRG